MDLSTMRKKLDYREYSSAQAFFADFKLMIRNCFHFNHAGTPVNLAGIELQRLFNDEWKNLPQPKLQPAHNADMGEDVDVEKIRALETRMGFKKGAAAINNGNGGHEAGGANGGGSDTSSDSSDSSC